MKGKRRIQKRRALAGLLACTLLLCACKKPTGEPDRTGSWGQINTELERSEGWRQIVQGSPFWLGEKAKFGEMHIPAEEGQRCIAQAGYIPLLDIE